ncbi:class I adenylate-forming enzyme family protein [Ramlibacter sp. AN1133]|uniref:class I adenylate-forming enzyme family protein n=1 Tax=Ramlibacter sp. AN1133 TaxID=3133429 RepID=UPI0030BBC787
MRAPASTLEIVQAWAAQDPARPVLREDDSELGYGAFAGMLLQCAALLRADGVRKGERVAVSGPGFGIQMVVLLACEALGAVTLSFQAEGDPDAGFLFTQVDRVFSGRAQALPAGVRFHLLDAGFVERIAAPYRGDPPQWTPAAWDEPARISRTSGSTGRSKFMLLRRQAQEQWVRPARDLLGYGRDTRLLLLGPLVINAIFARASQCLRQGGMLLAGHGRDIARLAPTDIYGLPLQLERLLAELPGGYVAHRPVSVATAGGLASPALRAQAAAVFGGRILNRYGGNEVHVVCDELDADGTGVLAPGVEVRVLDEGGRPLPDGEVGILAVRTPAMVEGYLDRPEETAAAFRDGWFVSGDLGAIVGSRRLRLVGRHDELVNIGGLKVPCAKLEELLRGQPGIADAAVLAVHLQGGAVSLGVAVVAAAGMTQEQAAQAVQRALQLGPQQAVRLLFLDAIPRLAMGKTDRMALMRLFSS